MEYQMIDNTLKSQIDLFKSVFKGKEDVLAVIRKQRQAIIFRKSTSKLHPHFT